MRTKLSKKKQELVKSLISKAYGKGHSIQSRLDYTISEIYDINLNVEYDYSLITKSYKRGKNYFYKIQCSHTLKTLAIFVSDWEPDGFWTGNKCQVIFALFGYLKQQEKNKKIFFLLTDPNSLINLLL
jgi:hypothetical protein